MMEIGQTTQLATPPAAATSAPRAISSDFDTFLKMLTVQLENQDPLNPVEGADYAVQLATFSGVEQQVKTNDLLRSLASQMGVSGMATMAAWVGKEARAAAPAYLNGAPITLSPKPVPTADRAEVVVRDIDGAEVQRFGIAVTNDPVEWAGVSADGYPLPRGQYTFDVLSYSQTEVIAAEQAEVYATVTEVRNQGNQTMLVLAGGAMVASDAVSALRDPNLR